MTDCKGKSCRYCSSQGIGFDIESSKAILGRVIDRIEYQIMHRSQINSLSGEELFNRVTGISEQSNKLTVIGGRPSSKHLDVAENILFGELETGTLSAIVGSETGNQSILRRYLAKISEVDASLIAFGALSDPEWIKIEKAVTQIVQESNLFTVSCKTMTLDSLVTAINKLKVQEPNLRLVLVSVDDFFHSFESDCCSTEKACLGGALRGLVDSLDISIVVTVNLSDEIDNRTDHKACLLDLPSHLNLSHYADNLALCEYPDLYEKDTNRHTNKVDIVVYNGWNSTRISIPVNEQMLISVEKCNLTEWI